jgi:glycosyltransferase involved in cell wall biosynthesis
VSTSSESLSIFLPTLHGGGAERMMHNLAHALVTQHVDVDVVIAGHPEPFIIAPPGIARTYLSSRRILTSLPALVRYLERRRPAALMSTLTHANIVAWASVRLSRYKPRLILREASTLSCNYSVTARPYYRLILPIARMAYSRADAVVAVSDGARADLIGSLAVPAAKVRTIPNPVVTRDMLTASKQPLAHPWLQQNDLPLVLSAGRLEESKDFLTLLDAFAEARRQQPMRLIILGEGSLRGLIKQRVVALNLSNVVALPGYVANPYAYMSRADLFVLSSRWEGSPNVLVEAIACGCRCIATDCPNGPREIFAAARHGKLVAVGDRRGLAEAMLLMLHSAPPSASAAIEYYSASRIADMYRNVLFHETTLACGDSSLHKGIRRARS